MDRPSKSVAAATALLRETRQGCSAELVKQVLTDFIDISEVFLSYETEGDDTGVRMELNLEALVVLVFAFPINCTP